MQTLTFADRTVGEVVAEDYRRAAVFKRFGIDFCCGGGRTVKQACDAKRASYDEVAQALQAVGQSRGEPQADARGWTLDFLADYIVNVHHAYVRDNIPTLRAFTAKVGRVHGEFNPEVVEIARLFDAIAVDLEQHTAKEERVLFPYIKELAQADAANRSLPHVPFGTVQNPIRVMELEHDHAGELMAEIRRLSSDFTPPAHACNTYRAAYAQLEAFEDDLHRHVHLENNVLFPRAIALEEKLTSALSA